MAEVATTPTASAPPLANTPLGRAAGGLDSCVHCGFCLTACPTYLTLEDENDSPRGRLVLMRAMLDGEIALDDPDAATHIDRCLGCRGCETACPSGVPYGHLLEATRETMASVRPIPFTARAVLFVFARPALLKFALAMARLVRASGVARLLGRLRSPRWFPFAMLASTDRPPRSTRSRRSVATDGQRVTLLTGCVMEGLFAPVNRATEDVLATRGYVLAQSSRQRCCGALHAHAGDAETARTLARANIEAFEEHGDALIAVNAAGCGAMLKEYAHLLADDPAWRDRAARVASRVRDVSELLAPVVTDATPAGTRVRVAYDAPCHLQHAQRVVAQPLAVLRSIAGVELVPLAGSDQCCGSAGIYNLVEPQVADDVLAPKLAAISASGAAIVATGNPGCLMQIGGGLLRNGSATTARHPVELLAESDAGA